MAGTLPGRALLGKFTPNQSPLDEFKRAVEEAGFQDLVKYLAHGETYNFDVPENRIQRAA